MPLLQDIICINSSTLSSLSLERICKISPPRWIVEVLYINTTRWLSPYSMIENSKSVALRNLHLATQSHFRVFTNRGILSHIFALLGREQIPQRDIGLRRVDQDILHCKKRVIPEPQYCLYVGHIIVPVKRFKRISVQYKSSRFCCYDICL